MTYLFKPDVPFDGEVKNDVGNPLPISKNTTVNSDTNPIIVKGTSDSSFFDPMQSDAFGRLRVSNPFTLFDSFHRYNDNGKVNTFTSGTATATHNANAGCIECTVGTSSGDKVYRESNRVFAYQPGKSLQILTTFSMNAAKPNLRQRIGYFDTDNGVFLEQDGTTINLVLRSSASGVLSERKVAKANWNIDTLPELDLERTQILFIDIEWLGVGSVRCGFVIDGVFRHCHTFHNANTEESPGVPRKIPYMTTACLPIRMEIENTGTTTGSSTYRQICSTVMSEGGYTLNGRPLGIGHLLSAPYTLASPNTVYPVFSMRLKSSRLGAIVLPKNYSLGLSGNTNFRFMLVVGGVTSGGTWVSAGDTSSVEYNLTGTSITGGRVQEWRQIISSNQTSGSVDVTDPFGYQLERNTFTGAGTELTLCLTTTGNNIGVYGAINWEEVT